MSARKTSARGTKRRSTADPTRFDDVPEHERITNFLSMALESLETATMLVRAKRASLHIVSSMVGYAATACACCLLRLHGIAIMSNVEPHTEMCDRMAALEAKGMAPEGAADTLRAIDNRFHEFGPAHERRVYQLLPLVRRLADRIENHDRRGGRISLAVQDLASALGIKQLSDLDDPPRKLDNRMSRHKEAFGAKAKRRTRKTARRP